MLRRERHKVDPKTLWGNVTTVCFHIVATRTTEPGNIPGVQNFPLIPRQKPHFEYRIALIVELRFIALHDRRAHEAVIGIMATADKGGMPPYPNSAIVGPFCPRWLATWSTAPAHNGSWVTEINFLSNLRIHASSSHGVNLGPQHHIPGNRCINRCNRLQNLNRFHGTCIVAAQRFGLSKTKEPLVYQSINNVIG